MSRLDLPLGEVRRDGDKWVLRYERAMAHPPEKVWRAITRSEHLRHWLPCDIVGERRQGADVELPFWPDHVEKYSIPEPILHGKILVWDPVRVFEWTWETDVLRWELEPVRDGTLLTFTTWLSDQDRDATTNVSAGYHVCLDQLIELLDRGSTGPLVDADVSQWEIQYAEAVAATSPG
jgi:uncharacterized protein YndB with AHSA1/START domain